MDNQPPPPPAAQFQPSSTPPKSGMSTGAKVGIGCGIAAIVIAAILGIGGYFAFNKIKDFAANPERTITETIVNNHPDLEDAQFDDDNKTVSVRYKKDGKRYTINYSDAANGKIQFQDDAGNTSTLGSTDLSEIPTWVPKPETASNYVVLFSTNNNGKSSGQYVAAAGGDLTKLHESLNKQLQDDGYTTKTSHASVGNDSGRWEISATKSDRKITITIVLNEKKGHLTTAWTE